MRIPVPTRRPAFLRVALIHTALFAAMGLPLVGCGDKKPVAPVDVEPEKSPEEIAKEREAVRLEGVRQRFQKTKELIRQSPDDWEIHIQNLEGRLYEAADTFLEKDVKAELDKMIQSREAFAQKKLDEIKGVAEGLVAEGEYEEAYLVVETFDPDGLLEETKAYRKYEDLKDWVVRAEDAEVEFNRLTRLARSQFRTGVLEEVAKAIGNLESFPDSFKDTAFHPQVREQIDEYLLTYKTLRAEEKAIVDVVETKIEIDDYLGNFVTAGKDVWTAEDGVASGENGTNGPAIFQIGDRKWTSYQVRLWLKTPSGQELRIAGSARPSGRGSKEVQFAFFKVDLESSDWVEVMVEFRDGRLKMQNLSTLEELIDPRTPRESPWGVALGIGPGEEVQVKDIRVKVFTQESDEEGGDAEDEGR